MIPRGDATWWGRDVFFIPFGVLHSILITFKKYKPTFLD